MREEEYREFQQELINEVKMDIHKGQISPLELQETIAWVERSEKMSPEEFWQDTEKLIDAFHRATGEPI